MGRIVITTNMSLDGVVQEPHGGEGFERGGWFATSGGDDLGAWAELVSLPDWRIGCIFTGSRHRGRGVARAAVAAVLSAIEEAGGGLVEAYPEQVEGRPPQRGAYFHTGPEDLFEEFGFERDRRIAKWRWVMRRRVPAA